MVEKEEHILVCDLISTSKHPNSIKAIAKQCTDCGKDIWASVSGIFQAGPHAKMVCRDCFNSFDDKEEIILTMPTEQQVKALMKEHGRSREEVLEGCQALCDYVERTGKFPDSNV